MRALDATIEQVTAETGVPYPSIGPYSDCSFVAVAWNEADRAPKLLDLARRWFTHLVIGVQESTDATLSIAKSIANRSTDQVVEHPHYGYGDKSMPDLISRAKTRWVFVVAFDEMPDPTLLGSLWSATAYGERHGIDAYWVPFRSFVEDVEYTEQHGHLRLFERRLGWPESLHARPVGKREVWWPHGAIVHTRSLDEMMRDYLRYYELGRGNSGWDNHNRLMMHDACAAVAEKHGWDFVERHEWWPKVREIAFG